MTGNRFGGSELCEICAQPHTDASYVATDADGVSTCGDCWDAALGVTIIVHCAPFPAGGALCACKKDLRKERWFAVGRTQEQRAYCEKCSLEFWGFTNADMIVSAIEDGRAARRRPEIGAHLRSSLTTPYDDTSPLAGMSDRGFSMGAVPNLLESCMNQSPLPGGLVPGHQS